MTPGPPFSAGGAAPWCGEGDCRGGVQILISGLWWCLAWGAGGWCMWVGRACVPVLEPPAATGSDAHAQSPPAHHFVLQPPARAAALQLAHLQQSGRRGTRARAWRQRRGRPLTRRRSARSPPRPLHPHPPTLCSYITSRSLPALPWRPRGSTMAPPRGGGGWVTGPASGPASGPSSAFSTALSALSVCEAMLSKVGWGHGNRRSPRGECGWVRARSRTGAARASGRLHLNARRPARPSPSFPPGAACDPRWRAPLGRTRRVAKLSNGGGQGGGTAGAPPPSLPALLPARAHRRWALSPCPARREAARTRRRAPTAAGARCPLGARSSRIVWPRA